MADGKTTFGRDGWNLPTPNGNGWKPGKWMHTRGDLIVCENGIHLCRPQDLIHWIGERLYEAEMKGAHIESDNKIVARSARLTQPIETINDVTLRLFAADCAESVLHYFESKYPDDDRPRKAIAAARGFARGEIDSAAW
ncbi:MAG: hypothetical protein GTO41_04860, partial [Burkholderiales bacterium]|nr:hypothetical protein [Burkholderiales bacterium]